METELERIYSQTKWQTENQADMAQQTWVEQAVRVLVPCKTKRGSTVDKIKSFAY